MLASCIAFDPGDRDYSKRIQYAAGKGRSMTNIFVQAKVWYEDIEMEQMHQRNERLIENKIWKYLLPGIMMSLALQLGNIVDTVFVGNFLGTEAMSAITLVLPMETLI